MKTLFERLSEENQAKLPINLVEELQANHFASVLDLLTIDKIIHLFKLYKKEDHFLTYSETIINYLNFFES